MKHYLSDQQIKILHKLLPYIPKYDTFSLTDLSDKVKEIDQSFKGWTYIASKFPSEHGRIFTDLWLNGFFEPVDKDKGVYKLTPDGHTLKDIGNYNKYLQQVNAEYAAKKQDTILKKYWYFWAGISFFAGAFLKRNINFTCTTTSKKESQVQIQKTDTNQSNPKNRQKSDTSYSQSNNRSR